MKCTVVRREDLSNVGLPALVLLRAGVLFKQSCLVGDGPWAAPTNIHDHGDGRYGSVAMLRDRDVRNHGGETVYLRLRDGGQEGAGVRPVPWIHRDLEDKEKGPSITAVLLSYGQLIMNYYFIMQKEWFNKSLFTVCSVQAKARFAWFSIKWEGTSKPSSLQSPLIEPQQ